MINLITIEIDLLSINFSDKSHSDKTLWLRPTLKYTNRTLLHQKLL
jgi:hypothetical protein